ncbi:hypothetical protein [Acetobacter sp. DsW_059]|uniref:hypothetical protein n=1 Tax=Acetobacter sp. DsW_059 TaxID=1670661 RepID=UPI000A37222D|nr:hypothetical protein [Acetobacter sp. DsW_059]OUJ10326.1 hypothetical protein HK25_07120 [Acetobacter sp. DsW_059]
MTTQAKRKKNQKSESLTIRLDPKMRFALEFVARLKGQTITKVIERAVTDAAEITYTGDNKNWLHYWDVCDGVRSIRLAMDSDTNPTFDEDELLDFIKIHWNYFSSTNNLLYLKRENIDVLWPKIEDLLKIWRECKSSDRLRCARVMKEILRNSGLSDQSWEASYKDEDLLVDRSDAGIPF